MHISHYQDRSLIQGVHDIPNIFPLVEVVGCDVLKSLSLEREVDVVRSPSAWLAAVNLSVGGVSVLSWCGMELFLKHGRRSSKVLYPVLLFCASRGWGEYVADRRQETGDRRMVFSCFVS